MVRRVGMGGYITEYGLRVRRRPGSQHLFAIDISVIKIVALSDAPSSPANKTACVVRLIDYYSTGLSSANSSWYKSKDY